jgi:putative ABC transport system permease protein
MLNEAVHSVESFLHDIRYALRALRKTPAFAATALAALALGIGANAAIFSVVNTVLLKPLAYPAADRIVLFFQTTPAGPNYGASATKFNALRRQTTAFQDVSAYEYRGAGLNLTGGAYPEQIHGIRVSADYFRLFGATLALGRTFNADEDRPNGPRVVVLSYGLWQRRFAGDPQMAGKTISLSGVPYTVVGIVGPAFNTELDTPPDVWLPFQIDPATTDHAQYFNVVARLKPGVTLGMANAQLQFAAGEFRRNFPNIMGPRDGFAIQPFQDAIVSDVRPSLLVLAGAVGFVLLIACANVANLLLVRATGRRREIAIRAAIGAGRGRIVRQLLTESVVLSVLGGALGLALGLAGVRALLAANPGDIPRIGQHGAAVAMDWRVVAFTAIVSLATGVLFGLIPALGASRADLTAALKAGGGRSGASLHQRKTRALLVAGEVALALVLLIGAALLIRTFAALNAVDPGFDRHNILTMRMSLASSRFRTTSDVNQLVTDAVRRIEALPSVARAGASYNLPLEGVFGIPYNIVGRPSASARYDGRGWMAVSPGYFDIFRIPILRGRAFTDRDDQAAARVAIVNEAFARKFPMAERVVLGQGYGPEFEEPARQIVGVAGNVHDYGLNRDPQPMVYVPTAQVTDGITALANRASTIAWIVRTRVAPHALRESIERELRESSGGLPVASVRSMEEVVSGSTARERFNMTLLSIFGCAALLLAAIGIYGLMAYSVQQRTQELGIRMALGAAPGRLRNAIVIEGMRLALAGAIAGEAAAFGLTRFLANFLFGVKAWDPLIFAAVPVLLSAVALLAVWIPALRATRIDPVAALRSE